MYLKTISLSVHARVGKKNKRNRSKETRKESQNKDSIIHSQGSFFKISITISFATKKTLFLQLKGLSYNCKKKEIKTFFKPLKPYTIRLPRNAKGFAYVGFKTEKHAKQSLIKDKCFIGKSFT